MSEFFMWDVNRVQLLFGQLWIKKLDKG